MLLLITVSIIAIGMTLLMNIYSVFSPFINTLGDIKDYNIAYYGAISSIERAYLVIRYHEAGFEGSGGWDGSSNIGPITDQKISDFSLLSKGNNGMLWNIVSKNIGSIPKSGNGNVDLELRGPTSKDYNKLDYNSSLEILLDSDITSDPQKYYSKNIDYQQFQGDQILGTIRLPDKIYQQFGNICVTCDNDENGITDGVVISRGMNGSLVSEQYSCSANHVQVINGSCGSDNGMNLSSTPLNLCSGGTPSPPPVTDGGVGGSYSWKCIGKYGGTSVDCNANHI